LVKPKPEQKPRGGSGRVTSSDREVEPRASKGAVLFQRTEREVQNAAVILFAAHHLDGPARRHAERNAALVKVKA